MEDRISKVSIINSIQTSRDSTTLIDWSSIMLGVLPWNSTSPITFHKTPKGMNAYDSTLVGIYLNNATKWSKKISKAAY